MESWCGVSRIGSEFNHCAEMNHESAKERNAEQGPSSPALFRVFVLSCFRDLPPLEAFAWNRITKARKYEMPKGDLSASDLAVRVFVLSCFRDLPAVLLAQKNHESAKVRKREMTKIPSKLPSVLGMPAMLPLLAPAHEKGGPGKAAWQIGG
jgi:hypothetical protein